MVKKLIREEMVAVLYSPGFGAGWSTWADEKFQETMLFDADVVQAVLDGNREQAAALVEARFPGEYVCVLGAANLKVQWIPEGSSFEVEEYDGSESIHILGSRRYHQA